MPDCGWPGRMPVARALSAGADPPSNVDGMRLGGLDALHELPSASVRKIRTLDARDATTRFGTGHSAGAIIVLTRVGR